MTMVPLQGSHRCVCELSSLIIVGDDDMHTDCDGFAPVDAPELEFAVATRTLLSSEGGVIAPGAVVTSCAGALLSGRCQHRLLILITNVAW